MVRTTGLRRNNDLQENQQANKEAEEAVFPVLACFGV